jgi:hypothetical protein
MDIFGGQVGLIKRTLPMALEAAAYGTLVLPREKRTRQSVLLNGQFSRGKTIGHQADSGYK